jgi:hypothetical protein
MLIKVSGAVMSLEIKNLARHNLKNLKTRLLPYIKNEEAFKRKKIG